jgi:hypothetical protein
VAQTATQIAKNPSFDRNKRNLADLTVQGDYDLPRGVDGVLYFALKVGDEGRRKVDCFELRIGKPLAM